MRLLVNWAISKIGIDMHTKESITKMLTERDDAVIRAILAIDRNQTTDERRGYVSVHENGVGFSKFHAKMGMAAADHYRRYVSGWSSAPEADHECGQQQTKEIK